MDGITPWDRARFDYCMNRWGTEYQHTEALWDFMQDFEPEPMTMDVINKAQFEFWRGHKELFKSRVKEYKTNKYARSEPKIFKVKVQATIRYSVDSEPAPDSRNDQACQRCWLVHPIMMEECP